MKYIKPTIITIITFPFFLIRVLVRFHTFGISAGIVSVVTYMINVQGRPEKFMTWDWILNIGVPSAALIFCFTAAILIIVYTESAITEYTEFVDDIHLNNLNNSIFSKEFRTRKSTVYYYIKKYEKEPLYKISFK